MSYLTVSDRCDCECHLPGSGILHFMACCHFCPRCGANVVFNRVVDHDRVCRSVEEKPRWKKFGVRT